MRYVILISLFLIGCEDSVQKIYGQAILDEVRIIGSDIREVKQTLKQVEQKNSPAFVQTMECVLFSKNTDTHAIASVTIPISGIYKVKYFSGVIEISYVDAGKTIHSVQNVIRDTCPQYKDFK